MRRRILGLVAMMMVVGAVEAQAVIITFGGKATVDGTVAIVTEDGGYMSVVSGEVAVAAFVDYDKTTGKGEGDAFAGGTVTALDSEGEPVKMPVAAKVSLDSPKQFGVGTVSLDAVLAPPNPDSAGGSGSFSFYADAASGGWSGSDTWEDPEGTGSARGTWEISDLEIEDLKDDILDDTVTAAVEVKTGGLDSFVLAFKPNFDLTLEQAVYLINDTSDINITGFNWTQEVLSSNMPASYFRQTFDPNESYPQKFPFNDPPLGGWETIANGGQYPYDDDTVPGVWDTRPGSAFDGTDQSELDTYTSDKVLVFKDTPEMGLDSGVEITFQTALIGMPNTILSDWYRWKFTQVGVGSSDIHQLNGGSGSSDGISSIEYLGQFPLTPADVQVLAEQGIVVASNVNVIPEPSTLAIWSLLGILGIAVGWWRKRTA